jgi:hypothetical protein
VGYFYYLLKKMKYLNSILVVIIITLFASCKDKENEKPILKIYPEDLNIQAYANEKVVFNIQANSDFRLNRFIITKKYAGEPESTIFDSTLSVNNISFQWAFRPSTDIKEDLYIYFKVINEKGYQTIVGKKLVFYGKRFDEYTGLEMYSANGGGTSAFNIETLEPASATNDSAFKDIMEFQTDTTNQHLSGKWVSSTSCQFVKFNTFDYGNASGLTARDAFNAGVKLTEIANIEVNDIYIIKITRLAPQDIFAVIKITNLVDVTGTESDYYEFSVKK